MIVSELVRMLLEKRGITGEAETNAFLAPDYVAHTHDPFLMNGMDVAVARIKDAMAQEERIAIYADFDCDGIPGAALLFDVFRKIGYLNFEVYIPHRDLEGYGFHEAAIEKLAAAGVKLIITVDVGTKANSAVDFAQKHAIDVIVTDHHEIDGELPNAVAVLNPKIAPYPFPSLCGTGVAFKLAQALLASMRKDGANIPEGWEKWLLDLVAIATVADMVPLVDENRALTFWGMQVLRKSMRPGILALCNELRLRRANLDETDIAFSFAPRVNAASRMGSPELALRLLTTDSREEAEKLAKELDALNASRKGVVSGIVRAAKKRVNERFATSDRVAVLGDTEWKPALLGLAANSLLDGRTGVVCLWGRDGNGKLKGSARSDGSLSVVELFAAASDAFEEYGGHAASGGFTLIAEKVHTLPEILASAALQIANAEKAAEKPADAVITLREISLALLKDLSRLAPFGVENPKPIFRIARIRITSVRRFGKEKNHVEVSLVCSETGSTHRAFQFFKAPESFSRTPVADMEADILATIERDTFKGPDRLALRIVDIL